MKKYFSLSSVIIAFLSTLCLGLLCLNLLEAVSAPVCAQKQDCPNVEYGSDKLVSFPKGARVRVYFGSSVSAADRAIWSRVFSNWSNLPGAEVQFFTESGTGPLAYTLNITTGSTGFDDPNYRGQVLDRYTDSSGYLQSATLQIHTNVTNDLAKELTMSHEVAHTVGIGHPVPNVTTTSTAASNHSPGNFNDTSTGSVIPTGCDKNILPTIYQNGGTKHSSAGSGSGGGGGIGDGGANGYKSYIFCTDYYLQTDYYISYDGGETWSYWYSSYEYVGTGCAPSGN